MISSQIQKYFKFLSSSDKAIFTCSFMRFDGDGVVPGFGCTFLEAAEIVAGAINFPADDLRATLHSTLNQTNLSGRKTENVTACRVLCVDLDRMVGEEELEEWKRLYVPQLIVESSPGKYHLYWKVSPCIPLERWKQFQLGLAWKLGGDKNAAGLTAMMRVPGVERICKDGKIWTPEIIWEVTQPGELTEKGILAKFKEMDAWVEEGTKELAEERRKIGELARAAWKARKGGDVGMAFSAMPEAGRNSALYLAVKEESFRCELDAEGAMSLGQGLNSKFPKPMDDWEVRKTVSSAWRKARAGLERRKEREGAAVGLLVGQPPVIAPTIYKVGASNGKSKTALPELGLVVSTPSQPEPPSAGPTAEPQLRLPKSIGLAGIRLGELLWEKDKERAIGMLAGGLMLKNYEGLADYVCEKWGEIGAFRKDGPVVFLEGRSRWGTAIHFGVGVDRDNFILVVSKALHTLGVACRKSENTGSLEERKRTEVLRKQLKRVPTQAQLSQIGRVVWAAACGWKPSRRQDPGIIVFQNGVFRLEGGGVFEPDEQAPLKYSHPVACRFDRNAWMALGLGKELENIVPRFAGYMQDWFPGDMGIVKVLLRYFGYCMTTDYSRQMFAFFYGPTRAGKGSICRTVCALLGESNYYSADYEVLDKNFKSAGMHDKLMVSIEEAEGGEKEVERRMNYLKKLLGGERVTFERKYAQPFEDNVIGKFVFQSNEPPRYQDKGHAIRARMICVGFEKSFETVDAFVDPAQRILETEADALGTLMALAWARGRGEPKCFAVEGSRALQAGEEEVGEAIDVIGTFMKKFCFYKEGKVRCSVLKLALEIVLHCEERSVAGRLDVRLKQETSVAFPKAKYGVWHDENKKSQRVFAGLAFDFEKFKQKYENECGIGTPAALKYQELLDTVKETE